MAIKAWRCSLFGCSLILAVSFTIVNYNPRGLVCQTNVLKLSPCQATRYPSPRLKPWASRGVSCETEDVQGPDLGDTFKTLASIILNDSLVVALRDLDYWEEITEVKDE